MWYAIQVFTGQEQEIAEICQERAAKEGEKIFVILSERMFRMPDGTWQPVRKSAFPSYIFAETNDIEDLRIRLRNIKTMTKILSAGDEMPAIYPEEENLLRNLTDEDHVIRLSEGFKDGEKLVVTDGPMKGYEGKVKWSNPHKKMAAIEIELLGQPVVVKLGIEILRRS